MIDSSGSPPPRVPWWVTALDVACIVILILTVRALFGGEPRISFSPSIRLTMGSWPRLVGWLAVLLVVRHVTWRAIPWHTRVFGWMRGLVVSESARAAWPPFLTSRLIVFLVGYVAVVTIGFATEPPFRALKNGVLDLYARFDSGWYFGIASQGYPSSFDPAGHSSIAFFPGLPMLMRWSASLLDVNRWEAGIVIVTVAFFWGLTYLYRLGRLDLEPDQARASLLFLTFYPFAVCYSAILTEAVFLLTAAAAFYHFRRTELVKAGIFALATGVLRPNGFLLSIPLGLLALLPFARQQGWLPGGASLDRIGWKTLVAQLATAALPVVAMLSFSAHVHGLTGDPFAWMKAQQAWGRGTAEVVNIWNARQALVETQGFSGYLQSYPVEALEAAAALFALAAVWPITRRFGLAYGVFVAMSVLPPLITMGSVSLGRYTAPLFPIFLWLGASVPPTRRPYWIAAFASGQALVAVLFYTWRPPY